MHICVLGAATSTHVVARAKIFAEFGHRVTLISPFDHRVDGIEAIICKRRGKSRLGWLWSIFKAVRSVKADIYHAHYGAELTTWVAWLVGKKPFVVTVMGGDVLFGEQGTNGPVGCWLTKKAVLAADLLTVKSEKLGQIVAGWGVVDHRIMDVIWGIDGRLFKLDPEGAIKRRAEWGLSCDDEILFSPRMLKSLYNQLLMVEALAIVLQENPKVKLVLSTYQQDEAYRKLVEQKAAELQVERKVIFVDALSPEMMAASYSAANLVLSLPLSDGTPQSVMESQACGTPVILVDLDHLKPMFSHRQNCWMVDGSVQSVANGIMTLLSDKSLAASLSQGGLDLIREKADFLSQAKAVEGRLMQLAGMD